MLVIMKKNVSEQDLEQVKKYLIDHDFDFHQSTGANRVIIGVIGDTLSIDKNEICCLAGVLDVYKIPEE